MNSSQQRSFFGSWHIPVLVFLFACGMAIRLYDLTDLPLDFHPTRQLFSALKARGMYYQSLSGVPEEQRQFAIQQGKMRATIEPEILERLTVFTWKFTGEKLWVARIYSSLFWLIGGIFLYLLARDLFSRDGALFTAAFYLALPYGVIASRSFQPDPLMVALLTGFWWAVNHWASRLFPADENDIESGKGTWGWMILASLLGGFAIFVKLNAAFFVIGGALGATLGRAPLRNLARNRQVWAMGILGILPGLGWVVYGLSRGFLGQQFGGRFIPSLLVSPSMYIGWAQMLAEVLGLGTFALSLLGLLLMKDVRKRSLLLGLWAAYFVFAIFFDYHISTHNYYSLPIIPIAALSLTPLAELVFVRLGESAARSLPTRVITSSVLALALFAVLWTSRVELKSENYRPQAEFWRQVGDIIRDHRVVALTQDYGLPLAYWGWAGAANWPDSTDIEYHALRGATATFEKTFARLTSGRELFLVTDLAELSRQPELKARLAEYAVLSHGDSYIIYALWEPLP
jgi:hypothetical protein